MNPARKMVSFLVPALTGLVHTTELLSSSACMSVCKMGTAGVPCVIILLGILRSSDGRHEAVKQCYVLGFFLQVVGDKVWGLFC